MAIADAQYTTERVTYTLHHEGRFYIVENVPARVDQETGDQYFSPSVVEKLQAMVLGGTQPSRIVEAPVFDFGEETA